MKFVVLKYANEIVYVYPYNGGDNFSPRFISWSLCVLKFALISLTLSITFVHILTYH